MPSPAISSASAKCAFSAGRPVAAQYSSRFARPDRCGRNPDPSTNEPIRESTGAPGAILWPKTRMVPSVGVIRPISIRSVVVLPAPFGPSRPSTWPGSTRKERSFTATKPPGYCLRSPSMTSGVSASSGSTSVARRRRSAANSTATMPIASVTPMPTSCPTGAGEPTEVPGTTGTARAVPPASATRNTAGAAGVANAWSVVPTTSRSEWPPSIGRTMPGSVTVTSTGVPSAGSPLTRNGAIALAGSTREPSWPTS